MTAELWYGVGLIVIAIVAVVAAVVWVALLEREWADRRRRRQPVVTIAPITVHPRHDHDIARARARRGSA